MTRRSLVGRWRLVSWTAGDGYPLGRDAIGVHARLDGRRLLLTGSQQFERATKEIRVLWEREAD